MLQFLLTIISPATDLFAFNSNNREVRLISKFSLPGQHKQQRQLFPMTCVLMAPWVTLSLLPAWFPLSLLCLKILVLGKPCPLVSAQVPRKRLTALISLYLISSPSVHLEQPRLRDVAYFSLHPGEWCPHLNQHALPLETLLNYLIIPPSD